jgi:glycosyltransferase involved in cell wall biosynthesis
MLYIGIATYKRSKKLDNLIQSIWKNDYKDYELVILYEKSDTETQEYLNQYKDHPKIHLRPSNKKEYVISNWNRFYEEFTPYADFTLALVDDIVLLPDCLSNALNKMALLFPDGDGVIGLKQNYPTNVDVKYNPAGQVLIGKRFLERYEDVNYHICCPNYKQWFQDDELLTFSKCLKKFGTTDNSVLIHYHPAYTPGHILDEAHTMVRGDLMQKDRDIFNHRKLKGLLWGKSWELTE